MLHVDDSMLKDIGRGFSIPAQPELLLKLQKSPQNKIQTLMRWQMLLHKILR